jgi:hypothetical protein
MKPSTSYANERVIMKVDLSEEWMNDAEGKLPRFKKL